MYENFQAIKHFVEYFSGIDPHQGYFLKVYEIGSEDLGFTDYYLKTAEISEIKSGIYNLIYETKEHPLEFLTSPKTEVMETITSIAEDDVDIKNQSNKKKRSMWDVELELDNYNLSFIGNSVDIDTWFTKKVTGRFQKNHCDVNNRDRENPSSKERRIVSSAEFAYGVTDNESVKSTVYSRINGYSTTPTNMHKDNSNFFGQKPTKYERVLDQPIHLYQGNILPLRDNIDYSDSLEEARLTLSESFKNNAEIYRSNLKLNMNLLYHTLTKTDFCELDSEDEEQNRDPLYSSENYKLKIAELYLSSRLYLNKDYMYYSTLYKSTSKLDGKFPQVYFEENKNFYLEMTKIVSELESKYLTFSFHEHINKHNLSKMSLTHGIEPVISSLKIALSTVVKGIETQERGDNTEYDISQLIYFNRATSQWEGWLVDLYRHNDSEDSIFNSSHYYSIIHSSTPDPNQNFFGYHLFNAQNLPKIGFVLVKDKKTGKDKMLLTSSMSVIESYKRYDNHFFSQSK